MYAKVFLTEKKTENKIVKFYFQDSNETKALKKKYSLSDKEFSAKTGEVALIKNDKKLIFAGLGKKQDYDKEFLRRAVANAVKTAESFTDEIFVEVPFIKKNYEESLFSVVEGAILASYKFLKYKTKLEEEKFLKKITFIVPKLNVKLQKIFDQAVNLSKNVCYTRDLQTMPGSIVGPNYFEKESKKLSKFPYVSVKVIKQKALKELGAEAITAVGRGAKEEPRMIVLEYNPRGAKKHLALAGKGVCFDTGGYNLKNSNNIETMKDDMSGAAAVLGFFKSVVEQKMKLRITAVIGVVYNMVSANSYFPGDILKALNGKTIEVANTDAEGRLVLADCLSYLTKDKKKKYDFIIDLATLTGSAMSTFGTQAAALMVNKNANNLKKLLEKAGNDSFERVWELPLWPEYSKDIKSDVADVKNLGYSFHAGAIAGGMFLKEFVREEDSWAHLDLGTCPWESRAHDYVCQYGNGFGVRLLYSLAKKLE